MLHLLWLVPAAPFAGFVLLVLAGHWLSRRLIAIVGVGSVGLSALVAAAIAAVFLSLQPPALAYSQTIWTWISVGRLRADITLYLDALSLVMALVVAVVAFLIHLYSTRYMAEESDFRRFFAYMNLFVGSMLTLLLADNFLLLLLGWEGVGLCSYLLIGFWYTDPANGRAARKAFVVTRTGDAAMLVGIFVLFSSLGTLRIQDLMARALQQWGEGSLLAVVAAALLLGGALGKSAQIPLQVWLPDAMAGPTPVSALIHAATMVTAGVYLIARTHVLFSLAPDVQLAVAIIGASTLLLGGFSALAQSDIKRMLAYSTISQIGYMFLALGVGAWSAAIFHFVTHAFFKSLLFLAAGVVILSLHQQNMMYMGGLRRSLPLAFWTFLVGAASMSALPLVTAGFYSKDLVLLSAWVAPVGGFWLWLAGTVGALLTSLYIFRALILVFFGLELQQPTPIRGPAATIPLLALAVLSIVGGSVDLPRTLGNFPALTGFLQSSLPGEPWLGVGPQTEVVLQVVSSLVALLGIGLAFLVYARRPEPSWEARALAAGAVCFWHSGWGFDWLYDRLFVRPFVAFTSWLSRDPVDWLYNSLALLGQASYGLLSATESGRVRWYSAGIALGAAIAIAIGVFV